MQESGEGEQVVPVEALELQRDAGRIPSHDQASELELSVTGKSKGDGESRAHRSPEPEESETGERDVLGDSRTEHPRAADLDRQVRGDARVRAFANESEIRRVRQQGIPRERMEGVSARSARRANFGAPPRSLSEKGARTS